MSHVSRIISLLPSATEIVASLDLKDQLVGRSHECDFPPDVQQLPVCTEPRYETVGNSGDINRAVTEVLEDALSIYSIHVEKIAELNPTHIITQSQCEVCAVSTKELENAIAEITGRSGIKVIDTNPEDLKEVYRDILRIAEGLEVAESGKNVVDQMKKGFSGQLDQGGNEIRPKVACIEWLDPIMVAGHWMYELIERAGGENLFPDPDKRWIDCQELINEDPEVMCIAPCGFDIDRTIREINVLASREGWQNIKAVRMNQVYIADGHQYFNRPGPRLVDTMRILCECFHTERFNPEFKNTGWVRLQQIT